MLFLSNSQNCCAQTFRLKINGNSTAENKTIDSLEYKNIHQNIKSIDNEINIISEKLYRIGYLENQIEEKNKISDSSYTVKFHLGEQIKTIHIYIGRNLLKNDFVSLLKIKDTVINCKDTELFLNYTLQKLEHNGFAFAKLKLTNFKKENSKFYAELNFELEEQRRVNSILIKFPKSNSTEKFPNSPLSQINSKYKNKVFNKETTDKIYEDFEKFSFTNQIKYPEILFTKDTTKIYVYLEKRKANVFDGFIGFSNNENKKIIFNGYLNFLLENILNAGEQLSLYWKNDGNKQKIFKAGIDIPYLLKSPLNLKAELQIFKQDSTFQNTKNSIDLGYLISHNSRIFLGYQSTESSDIQNTNNKTISDYKNSFTTTSFKYSKLERENLIFTNKVKIEFTAGLGKRNTNNSLETATNSNQFQAILEAMYNFHINKGNYINIRSQNYYLKSQNYITNELFRFGGINSIRGFEENSLQAKTMSSIQIEYRYLVSQNLYIHSITDYCIYTDPFSEQKEKNNRNLVGIGIGVGVQTKNGLLKLALANGSTEKEEKKFYNTMINICYNVKFWLQKKKGFHLLGKLTNY